jgi:UDP-glucuronate 4-epimerase
MDKDLLFIGKDTGSSMDNNPWIRDMLRYCYGKDNSNRGEIAELKRKPSVYNAGVIGGRRDIMIKFLALVITELDALPHQKNCNMPAVNVVAHKYFEDRIYTGYPWTSELGKHEKNPSGVYIVHK